MEVRLTKAVALPSFPALMGCSLHRGGYQNGMAKSWNMATLPR
jgi:hypothetical protein